MIFRSLDASHDWNFGQGLQSYATGKAAIGLNVQTRILSFLGNCFFDTLAGINWLIYFGTPGQTQQILLSVQACILQSYGVTKVNSVTLNETLAEGVILTFNINDMYSKNAPYSQSLQVNSPGQG